MKIQKIVSLTICVWIVSMLAGQASADVVTFSDINDSNNASGTEPREFWDIATTAPTGDKTLGIGVLDFFADGGTIFAFDTLSVTITADPGYVITKITYMESGNRTVNAGGTAIYTGSATANGLANPLGQNIFPAGSNGFWSAGAEFDYQIADAISSVFFDVTNVLIATGDAVISKGAASITVETAPVPLPPALWMLGSALVGLFAVRRKNA